MSTATPTNWGKLTGCLQLSDERIYWQYNTELAEKNFTLDAWDKHAHSENFV